MVKSFLFAFVKIIVGGKCHLALFNRVKHGGTHVASFFPLQ